MTHIKVVTNEMISSMGFHKKSGGIIEYTISTHEELKIIEWLNGIRGNGEGIDTMLFPVLEYTYEVSGDIGYVFEVKELITGNTLDLTDIDKF